MLTRKLQIVQIVQYSLSSENSQKKLGVSGAIYFYDCRFHEGNKRSWAVALPIAIVAVSGRVELCASSEFQRKPVGRTITHFSTVAWFAGHCSTHAERWTIPSGSSLKRDINRLQPSLYPPPRIQPTYMDPMEKASFPLVESVHSFSLSVISFFFQR